MNRRQAIPALTLLGGAILAAALPALAEWAGTGYTLSWWTVDGGGGSGSGGDYTLTGTIGQAEGGVQLQGGTYTLAGGFWGAGTAHEYDVYLPLVLRQAP